MMNTRLLFAATLLGIAGADEGFYKADYSANKQFQDALADGHTLEALFKPGG